MAEAAAAQAAAADPQQQGSLRVGGGGGGGSRRDKRGQPNLRVPWAALSYVTCELNYGGRITDENDRRLCKVLLSDLYRPEVLLADRNYAFSPSGSYKPPLRGSTVKQTRLHIQEYPLIDAPEIFGLHDNADISCAAKQATELFDAACLLQPRAAGARHDEVDEIVGRVIDDLEERIPLPFDIAAARQAFPYAYLECNNTVLVQELSRYNALTTYVRSSVGELRDAFAGRVAMTEELEGIAAAIHSNRLPEEWGRRSYASRKPLAAWVSDLIQRLTFFDNWLTRGQPGGYPGQVGEFWLPAFFQPQCFLTAVLQNHARRNGLPIDGIRFEHQVLSKVAKRRELPMSGAHIYGLYLEGASWNSKDRTLTEPLPKQLYAEMNVIWLKPTQEPPMPASGVDGANYYDCPVYKTTGRAAAKLQTGSDPHSGANFVCHVRLPSAAGAGEAHWIKRSAALICSLDD